MKVFALAQMDGKIMTTATVIDTTNETTTNNLWSLYF